MESKQSNLGKSSKSVESWGSDEWVEPATAESLYLEIKPQDFRSYTANKDGVSDPLSVRIAPQYTTMLDILVAKLGRLGLPVRMRSDILRFCVVFGVNALNEYLKKFETEEESSWLRVMQKMRDDHEQAEQLELVSKVKENINLKITGLMQIWWYGDFDKLVESVDQVIQTIFSYIDVDNYIFHVNVKEYAESPKFQDILQALKDINRFTKTMKTFETVYETRVKGVKR